MAKANPDATTTPFTPEQRSLLKDAALAATTAFNRIVEGHPLLAMDAHSPAELEADRQTDNAQMKSGFRRLMDTAEAEIAQFTYRDDLGALFRLMAEQKVRDEATSGWDAAADTRASLFRAQVEGQKFLHIRDLIAAKVPATREHLLASLDLLAEGISHSDEGDFFAAWVRNIASGVKVTP